MFLSVHSPYNMVDRRMELEHLPMSHTSGMAQSPWSPLAGGGLTGKYVRGTAQSQPAGTRFGDETDAGKLRRFSGGVLDIVDAIRPLAEARGCTVSQLALAWVMSRPGVTAPLVGPRTLDQFEDNLGAIGVEVDGEVESALDTVVPPGEHVAEFYEASFGPNLHRW